MQEGMFSRGIPKVPVIGNVESPVHHLEGRGEETKMDKWDETPRSMESRWGLVAGKNLLRES